MMDYQIGETVIFYILLLIVLALIYFPILKWSRRKNAAERERRNKQSGLGTPTDKHLSDQETPPMTREEFYSCLNFMFMHGVIDHKQYSELVQKATPFLAWPND